MLHEKQQLQEELASKLEGSELAAEAAAKALRASEATASDLESRHNDLRQQLDEQKAAAAAAEAQAKEHAAAASLSNC